MALRDDNLNRRDSDNRCGPPRAFRVAEGSSTGVRSDWQSGGPEVIDEIQGYGEPSACSNVALPAVIDRQALDGRYGESDLADTSAAFMLGGVREGTSRHPEARLAVHLLTVIEPEVRLDDLGRRLSGG